MSRIRNEYSVVETVVLRMCHPDRHSSGDRVLIHKFSRTAAVLPEVATTTTNLERSHGHELRHAGGLSTSLSILIIGLRKGILSE